MSETAGELIHFSIQRQCFSVDLIYLALDSVERLCATDLPIYCVPVLDGRQLHELLAADGTTTPGATAALDRVGGDSKM